MAASALIVGAGSGLSASLARRFAREGMQVTLAARNAEKLAGLAAETKSRAYRCDASDPDAVSRLFDDVRQNSGIPEIVVFNASGRYRGSVETLDPSQVLDAYRIGAFGGFLVAQAAAKMMLRQGSGSIFFTGATASVKAMPQSVPFAMQKFALRALAQSLARELSPRNIHVAHFIIDGGIASSWAGREANETPDKWLDPDAIAETYWQIHRQHRSAWTWEIELRPWVEKF